VAALLRRLSPEGCRGGRPSSAAPARGPRRQRTCGRPATVRRA